MNPKLRKLKWPFILCLIVYGLLSVPITRDITIHTLSPIITVARRAGDSVVNSGRLIVSIPNLAKENGRLAFRVNELTALEITNAELKHENELLRKELSLTTPQGGNELIAAQVISRTSSVSQQAIVVNKGAEDGFAKGMAVVAQGYYVGKVEEVLPRSSRITLLTSAQSMIPIVLEKSRSIGLLRGGVEGLLVDEIPRDITIEPGEAVVTAPIGDIVKSGIPVGTVSKLLSGKSDVFQSARLVSPIDLSRLEVVFGVK